jgi:hypothetical protein
MVGRLVSEGATELACKKMAEELGPSFMQAHLRLVTASTICAFPRMEQWRYS